jgi:hypothetical protein
MILTTALLLNCDFEAKIKAEIKSDAQTIAVYDRFIEAEQKVHLDPEVIELFQKLFKEVETQKFDFK